MAEAWLFERWAGAGAAQSLLNDVVFVPLAFAHRSSPNSHVDNPFANEDSCDTVRWIFCREIKS